LQLSCQWDDLANIHKYAESGYDILINTTPSPMPVDKDVLLANALIMDIKTKPKNTELIDNAKNKGCQVIYGYEMFLEQALGQFNIWFGEESVTPKAHNVLEREILKCL